MAVADYAFPILSTSLPVLDVDTQNGFYEVEHDPASWDRALPASQGLYENQYEKDACDAGFICQIKGEEGHKVVSVACQLLCTMTHRGATSADSCDGDSAGVTTGIPHLFPVRLKRDIGCELPEAGQYAVGNAFFRANDPAGLQKQQSVFAEIADELGLGVLEWREVPTKSTIMGSAAASKEPAVLQPFIVL